jgi:hypothetical protein
VTYTVAESRISYIVVRQHGVGILLALSGKSKLLLADLENYCGEKDIS